MTKLGKTLTVGLLLVRVMGWSSVCLADDGPDLDDTVTNSAETTPTLDGSEIQVLDQSEFEERLRAFEGRQYPAIAYLGGEMLGVDPEFVHDCREGLEMIYQRDYSGAMSHWDDLGRKWRGTGVAPVGRVLVWQALMLENFDFRYEDQYRTALWQARQELEEAMMQPGNEAWEHFMMGGMLGVDAIHLMRKGEYVTSLSRGYEAMRSIERCQELAPEFPDAILGDGLFNYWSTVVSMNTRSIPNTGDHRALGISQIMRVEQQGIFLASPALLALTYTWIEERDYRRALQSAQRNQEAYPDNVINNQVLGRVYRYRRMYTESEATFGDVLRVDPDNRRVHYYLGQLYLRWNRPDDALESLDTYLAFPDLSDMEEGSALYYKGNVYYTNGDLETARDLYREAWRVGRIRRARSRMESIDRRAENRE